MNIHKNARTTPYSRSQIVRRVMGLRGTSRCAASASPANRSQPHSRCHPPGSGEFCARRVCDLDPKEPVRRYQREHPGELIHIAIKKLGHFERVGHRITRNRAGRSTTNGRSKGAGCARIPNFRPSQRRTRTLAGQLQLASTARQRTIHAAHQSARSTDEHLLRLHS